MSVGADRIERELGLRGGLLDFIRMAWPLVEPGVPFQENWHIEEICKVLEAVERGELRRLVINIPPGCMKSLTTSVFWPVWSWIRNPGSRFMYASFDASLTKRDAGKSLAIIHSQWFKDRWGDRVLVPKEVSVTDYANGSGGFRFSTSVEGKATGRHVDIQVVDDPIKPQDVSKTSLANCKNWWTGTMSTRFRDLKTSRRVIIMQRLHEEDLAGLCIREGYELVRFPMEYEGSAPDPRDRRTVDGELLWPSHANSDEVATLKRELGSTNAAAQLQQRPVPEGGAVFRREWMRTWRRPEDPIGEPARVALPEQFDTIVQSWDCAFKGTDSSDFVVGRVWGRKGSQFFLLDSVRERMGFGATIEAIRSTTRKWPRAITKLIEDKANGSAVIETLQKEIPGIIAVNPQGGKEARANAVAPLFEAGNVFDPPPETYRWVDQARDERLAFPRGANDDGVDADSQALLYLHQKSSRFAAAMARLRSSGGLLRRFEG